MVLSTRRKTTTTLVFLLTLGMKDGRGVTSGFPRQAGEPVYSIYPRPVGRVVALCGWGCVAYDSLVSCCANARFYAEASESNELAHALLVELVERINTRYTSWTNRACVCACACRCSCKGASIGATSSQIIAAPNAALSKNIHAVLVFCSFRRLRIVHGEAAYLWVSHVSHVGCQLRLSVLRRSFFCGGLTHSRQFCAICSSPSIVAS